MTKHHWGIRIVAFAAVGSLLAAACGSDKGSEGSSTSTPVTTAASEASAGSGTSASEASTAVDTAPADTASAGTAVATTEAQPGGTTATVAGSSDTAANAVPTESGPADSTLAPVKVGWLNNDEGVVSFPGATVGFTAALAYINDRLGGIDGHPLEGVFCSAGLDQDSVRQCAQQMANDNDVQIITSGIVVVTDPIYPVLKEAGKPFLVGTPANLPDFTNPDFALAYLPGVPGVSVGAPVYAVDVLHAKKLAIVVSNSDAGRSAIALTKQVLKNDPVEIVSVFVNDDEADYTGPIQAAGAADADAFVPLVAQTGCIQIANALETLAIKAPVVTLGTCATPKVRADVGDKIVGWTIGSSGASPTFSAPGTDAEVDHYTSVFPEYGDPSAMLDGAAVTGFTMAMTLWQIGNGIGYDKLDSTTWFEGMKAFTGPVYLGPRSLNCGSVALFPGLCSTQTRWWALTKDGADPVNGGQSIDPFNRNAG